MSDSIQRETNSPNPEEIGENSHNSRTHEFLSRPTSPVFERATSSLDQLTPEQAILTIENNTSIESIFGETNDGDEKYSPTDLQSFTVENLLTERTQDKQLIIILKAQIALFKYQQILQMVEASASKAGGHTQALEDSLYEAMASRERANGANRAGITYASPEAEIAHLEECRNEEIYARERQQRAEQKIVEIDAKREAFRKGRIAILGLLEQFDQRISSNPTLAAIQRQIEKVLSQTVVAADNAERAWIYERINMEELVKNWSGPIRLWKANQLSPEEQKKLASQTNDPFQRLDEWYKEKRSNCSERQNDELLYLRLAHESDLLKISKSKKDLILGKKLFAEQQYKQDSTAIGEKYYQIGEKIKAKYVEKKQKLQQKVEKREREYLHLKLQSASVSPETQPDASNIGYFLLDDKKYPLLCIGDSSVAHHPYWNSFDGKVYYALHADEPSRLSQLSLKFHPNNVGEIQFTLDDTLKKVSHPWPHPSNRISIQLSDTSSSTDSSIEVHVVDQQQKPINRGYLTQLQNAFSKKSKEQQARPLDLPTLENQLENLRNKFYHDMTRLHKERHSRSQQIIDSHEEEQETSQEAAIADSNKNIDEKLRNIEKRFKEEETKLAHRIAKAHIRRDQLDTVQLSASEQERRFVQRYLQDQQASPSFQAMIHRLEKRTTPQGSDATPTYRIQNRLNKNIYELPVAPGFVPSRFAFIDAEGQLHSTNSPANFSRTADADWFLVVHPDEASQDTILVLVSDQSANVQSSGESTDQERQHAQELILRQQNTDEFNSFRQELAHKQGKKVQQPGPNDYPVQDLLANHLYYFPVISGKSSMRFAFCNTDMEIPELHFSNTVANFPSQEGWYLLGRSTNGDVPTGYAVLVLGEHQGPTVQLDAEQAKLAKRKLTAIPIVKKGDEFFQQNNWKKALEKYNLAHPLDRENPLILQKRGRTHYGLNNFKASYDDLTESLKLARHPETLYFRGNALVGLNRPKEAINDLNEALGLETKPWQRATLFARIAYTYHFSLKNPQEAFKACERALAINQQQQEALYVREQVLKKLSPEEVVALTSELDNSQPSSGGPEQPEGRQSAADLFRQGNQQVQEENFAKALEFYNLTLENYRGNKKKDFAIIYANRANTLRLLERYTESLKDFDLAIENDPKDGQSHYLRGFVLSELGRDLEAVESFDLALTNGFQGIRIYMSRGTSNFKLGRYDEAENDYSRAQKIEPENQAIRQSLEAIARRKSESRSPENTETLTKDKSKLPLDSKEPEQTKEELDAGTLFGYGQQQFKQGNYEKALELYNLTLENYRGNNKKELAAIYVQRANTLKLLKRHTEALADCDRAIENDPKDGRYHHQRGLVLVRLGQDGEAVKSYDLALDNEFQNGSVYISRGAAYLRLGRYEEAKQDYSRALTINPDEKQTEVIKQALEKIASRKGKSCSTENTENISTTLTEDQSNLQQDVKDQEQIQDEIDAETIFIQGNQQFQQINYEKALELYSLILENYRGKNKKNLAMIYGNRATAFLQLNRYDEAENDYRRAQEIDPENENDKKGLEDVQKKLKHKAYCSEATTLFENGDYEEALNTCEKARELFRFSVPAYGNLSGPVYDTMVAIFSKLEQYNDIINVSDDYIQSLPPSYYSKPHICKIKALFQLGNYEEVINICDPAIKSNTAVV